MFFSFPFQTALILVWEQCCKSSCTAPPERKKGASMRAIERVIGITIGTVFLAAGPALAAPAGHAPAIGWTTADAVAAQRVPGNILATRLENDGGRAVYGVEIRTAGDELKQVQVDARTARVVGVHEVTEPGLVGEIEAP
jgi:hypothetical protein